MFGAKPIFEVYQPESNISIDDLGKEHGFRTPSDLKDWFLKVGFGDIDDELSIRADWISVIDRGELQGHVIFAQDGLGNFYTFDPEDGEIHYICRSWPEFALIAKSFQDFIIELEKRDYQIYDWVDSLKARPYDWGV